MSLERVPPQSIDAEQSVLGALLIDREALSVVTDIIRPTDFYRESHRIIYEAMQELYQKHEAIDLITLSEALRRREKLESIGGVTYLATLADVVPTSANVAHYARIVSDKSLLRAIIQAGTSVAQKGFDPARDPVELLDEAEQAVFSLATRRHITGYEHLQDVLVHAMESLEQAKDGLTGVPTGFRDLDDKLAGLQRSDLIVLAARPSMGKSQLALNIARSAAAVGATTVFFSLEMPKEQLALRLVCAESRLDSQKLRQQTFSEEEWRHFAQGVAKLSKLPIYIDDSPGLNVLEIRARARRIKSQYGLGLVIVDYLQLLEAVNNRFDNRQQEISLISRALKAMARELEVPVLALSQLSRAVEARSDKRPMLSDLRESGAIEQDADVVAFIYRESYYTPNMGGDIAEVIIAKQRNGPTGTCKLYFHKECGLFAGVDDRHAS